MSGNEKHAAEVEGIYSAFEPRVGKASSLDQILGYCGEMYELIGNINRKYGFGKKDGYDHDSIWFIAGRVLSMKISDSTVENQINSLSKTAMAEKIFKSIDDWVKAQK